jgi:hypothetical protein
LAELSGVHAAVPWLPMVGTAGNKPIGNMAGSFFSPFLTLAVLMTENPSLLGISNSNSDWIVPCGSQLDGFSLSQTGFPVSNVVHAYEMK